MYCHKVEGPESRVYKVRVLDELTGREIAGIDI